MKIAMVGKYPPIEGGVSTHQYWCARALARRGHEVHIVTNANEVEPTFRVLMRDSDWSQCEVEYPEGGSVRVHWTEVADRNQRHIPWHNPFVTKLSSLAARIIDQHDLELVFSYYLEPYGIAGHLAAQMTRRPHVVKHAGSDVGHLRSHPQLGPLYDHIFRSAQGVVTGGGLVAELKALGVDESRMSRGDDVRVPESVFQASGEALDLQRVMRETADDSVLKGMCHGAPGPPPYLGVYGKLGDAKGTFDLLRAVKRVRDRGQHLSLIVVGHGFHRTETRFQAMVTELGLSECVLQLPFLPNWRIPELIRLCTAVCFLEREFPIAFHTPVVSREVLACGTCLIAPEEILARQLFPERLIDRFNCIAVRNVRDIDELAGAIRFALDDPARAERIGRRGNEYSRETEALRDFPANYEAVFARVVDASAAAAISPVADASEDEFPWTRKIVESLPDGERTDVQACASEYEYGSDAWALAVYARLLALVDEGRLVRSILLEAIRFELQLSGGLNQGDAAAERLPSSVFRLSVGSDRVLETDLPSLYVQQSPGLTIEAYEYDIGELLEARSRRDLPLWISRRRSHAAIVPG
jgi:glycosyltransferase involved in cell wall biosynthesis